MLTVDNSDICFSRGMEHIRSSGYQYSNKRTTPKFSQPWVTQKSIMQMSCLLEKQQPINQTTHYEVRYKKRPFWRCFCHLKCITAPVDMLSKSTWIKWEKNQQNKLTLNIMYCMIPRISFNPEQHQTHNLNCFDYYKICRKPQLAFRVLNAWRC